MVNSYERDNQGIARYIKASMEDLDPILDVDPNNRPNHAQKGGSFISREFSFPTHRFIGGLSLVSNPNIAFTEGTQLGYGLWIYYHVLAPENLLLIKDSESEPLQSRNPSRVYFSEGGESFVDFTYSPVNDTLRERLKVHLTDETFLERIPRENKERLQVRHAHSIGFLSADMWNGVTTEALRELSREHPQRFPDFSNFLQEFYTQHETV